ncbi:Uncharacterized protein FKW44_000249 [Caligus rogercresseyi]|uniref:Aldehyde dehydrogenase domain-containing protein n=1 Tax=Caligus rogercresseyi TaxID=217165 RepID=A0A7T8KH49_CALRO|nr:Uncharacterized protein FKW44_000249 [Caligus rogercresseyi]
MAGKVNIKYTQLFIDNEFVDAENGATFGTIDPATEEVAAKVAFGTAKKAFHHDSEWRTMDASKRGELMIKLAGLMERDKDIIAKLITIDNGKPLSLSEQEVAFALKVIRYYAGFSDKIHGSTLPVDGNFMSYTRKEPVGVVAQIVPWNFPVAMISWKWGPALATGCTVVLKPAEQTPLSSLYIASLGVINIVTGDGPLTGNAFSKNMDVDKITFTGSTEVGKLISACASDSNLKRSPIVVMNDCPSLDKAVEICHAAVFTFVGQVCCAGTRVLVQSGIHDEFVKKSAELAKSTQDGPQVNKEQMEKTLGLIECGVKEGALVHTGGKRAGSKGYYVEPTVFSNVRDDMTIAKEEIFGPVQSILKFDTLEEAIERANDTTYGLAAGIITSNHDAMTRFSQCVQAGSIWINCYNTVMTQAPFGGFKQSGIGRELGEEGLRNYLESKTITIAINSKCS